MCTNNSMCGSSNNNQCTPQLGPFEAIDAACISSPAEIGFVIPFSSGPFPVLLTSLVSGLPNSVFLLGFGSSVQITASPIIDVTLTGNASAGLGMV